MKPVFIVPSSLIGFSVIMWVIFVAAGHLEFFAPLKYLFPICTLAYFSWNAYDDRVFRDGLTWSLIPDLLLLFAVSIIFGIFASLGLLIAFYVLAVVFFAIFY